MFQICYTMFRDRYRFQPLMPMSTDLFFSCDDRLVLHWPDPATSVTGSGHEVGRVRPYERGRNLV